MAKLELGQLLGQKDLNLVAETLAALDAPVGKDGFVLPPASLESGEREIELTDYSVKLTGEVALELAILPAAAAADLFRAGETASAPAGQSYAQLSFRAKAGIEAESPNIQASAFTLSVGGGLEAELGYRHLLPVDQTAKRRAAFVALVKRSRLPYLVDFADLADGELHTFDRQFRLKLDVGAKYGGEFAEIFDIWRDAFRGLPLRLQVHGEYGLEAALGVALYEEMRLAVGKAALAQPGWARIQLRRVRERRLTAGATFALQLHYDLAASAQEIADALLGEALSLIPFRNALDSWRATAAMVASKDWAKLRTTLSKKASAAVGELVADAGWLDKIATSPTLQKALARATDLVAKYDALDERLQSLWDRLLLSTGLGKDSELRDLLERIAALPEPASLLGDDQKKAIALVEALSGQSLEELLLGGPEIEELFADVRRTAKSGLDFLDGFPADLFARIEGFAEKTGVAKVIAFLRTNATSATQLKASAEGWIAAWVEDVVGKGLDQIEAKDAAALRQWAGAANELLAAPEVFKQRIDALLGRLKGDVGFSVGFEFDRAVRTTAVLDLEVDPRADWVDKRLRNALRSGDVRGVLAALPEGRSDRDDEVEDAPVPYLLRECVLTSRRVSSWSTNVFFSFLGMTSEKRIRLQEARLEIQPQADGSYRRRGSYGGAFQFARRTGKAQDGGLLTGSVWHTVSARADGEKDLTQALSRAFQSATDELRLTVQRDDPKTLPAELEAVDALLANLGMAPPPGGALEDVVPAGAETRVIAEVRIPGGVGAFWSGLGAVGAELKKKKRSADWERDLLNAAHRWLDEPLVTRQVSDLPLGPVLAVFLGDPYFRENWVLGPQPYADQALGDHPVPHNRVQVKIGDKTRTLTVVKRFQNTFQWGDNNEFEPIRNLMWVYGAAPGDFGEAESAWTLAQGKAGKTGTPEQLERFLRAASRALAHGTAKGWDSTLFGVWLTLARLARARPDLLAGARGYAVARWRQEDGNWSQPQRRRLDPLALRAELAVPGKVFPA